jgi:hypothetical protein
MTDVSGYQRKKKMLRLSNKENLKGVNIKEEDRDYFSSVGILLSETWYHVMWRLVQLK